MSNDPVARTRPSLGFPHTVLDTSVQARPRWWFQLVATETRQTGSVPLPTGSSPTGGPVITESHIKSRPERLAEPNYPDNRLSCWPHCRCCSDLCLQFPSRHLTATEWTRLVGVKPPATEHKTLVSRRPSSAFPRDTRPGAYTGITTVCLCSLGCLVAQEHSISISGPYPDGN